MVHCGMCCKVLALGAVSTDPSPEINLLFDAELSQVAQTPQSAGKVTPGGLLLRRSLANKA